MYSSIVFIIIMQTLYNSFDFRFLYIKYIFLLVLNICVTFFNENSFCHYLLKSRHLIVFYYIKSLYGISNLESWGEKKKSNSFVMQVNAGRQL